MITIDDLLPLLSKVTGYEGYYMALCPYLHHGQQEQNPSLLVGNDGWFKCLSCGEKGKHDKLYKRIYSGKYSGLEPDEEDKYHGFTPNLPPNTKGWNEYVLQCRRNLDETPNIQNYWKIRGFLQKDIDKFRLGTTQGAWATIPMYYGSMEHPIRVSLRAYHHTLLSNGIRYWNSPGSPILFTPSPKLVSTKSKIAVTYGLIDALAVTSLGFAGVTPSSGKDSLRINWLRGLGAKEFYFIPDEGEESTANNHIENLGVRASRIDLPYLEHNTTDPADYLQAGKSEILREILERYLDE